MKISHSQVTTSGPFRENTRAQLEVEALGFDQIIIRSVSMKFVVELFLAGEHLAELRDLIDERILEISELERTLGAA